jgi:hypothetical protein
MGWELMELARLVMCGQLVGKGSRRISSNKSTLYSGSDNYSTEC